VLIRNRGILDCPQIETREEPIADQRLVVRDRQAQVLVGRRALGELKQALAKLGQGRPVTLASARTAMVRFEVAANTQPGLSWREHRGDRRTPPGRTAGIGRVADLLPRAWLAARQAEDQRPGQAPVVTA
jgi:hypothetical protein